MDDLKDVELRPKEKIDVEHTIQNVYVRGWKYFLLHDRRKIYNKLLQYLAMHYLTPPNLRVRLQMMRGVRFKDPKSVFLGDHINFDERLPENIYIGKGFCMAAGCRILSHRFISWRFVERGDVHIEDYVRVGVNAIIVGPIHVGEGAAIAPGAIALKDVPPYTVVAGVPAKPIAIVPKEIVDYELFTKGDYETWREDVKGYLVFARKEKEKKEKRVSEG
jgi:acetyltransferase-like isoleucine patch superfamily enzyme